MSTPTPSTLTLPNPDTGAQQVASSSSASSSSASSLVPSRSASPQPPHHAQQDEQQHAHAHRTRHRIVDALGAPVVASSSASASPDSECERLFQSRIWGATCDGLDSICDSVLLPKLNPDDRLFFRYKINLLFSPFSFILVKVFRILRQLRRTAWKPDVSTSSAPPSRSVVPLPNPATAWRKFSVLNLVFTIHFLGPGQGCLFKKILIKNK